jgi:hypothetical protein
MGVFSSHISLFLLPPLDPVRAGIRFTLLAILASSDEMSWLIDRE